MKGNVYSSRHRPQSRRQGPKISAGSKRPGEAREGCTRCGGAKGRAWGEKGGRNILRVEAVIKKKRREHMKLKPLHGGEDTSWTVWKSLCDSNGCSFIMRWDRANRRAKLKCQGTGGRRYTGPRLQIVSKWGVIGCLHTLQVVCWSQQWQSTDTHTHTHTHTHSGRSIICLQNHRMLFGKYHCQTRKEKRDSETAKSQRIRHLLAYHATNLTALWE